MPMMYKTKLCILYCTLYTVDCRLYCTLYDPKALYINIFIAVMVVVVVLWWWWWQRW